jgi:hypothetical protein
MDWKTQMKSDEAELKMIVDQLEQVQGQEEAARIERKLNALMLSRKLVEIRARVDCRMGGCTLHEQSMLQYKVRMEYPLYSHLSSLSIMPPEYVDLSIA